MKKYIIRRLLLGLIVLLGVIVITFAITRILPADPARKWAGMKATPAQIQQATIELGLDKPVYVQFGKYLGDLMHGNLGFSYRTHRPVKDEIMEAFPATVEMAIVSMVMAVILGIFLGIYSAKYKDKLLDHFMRVFSIGAVSLPSFWIALAFQIIFYGTLHIMPLGGRVSTHISIMYEMPHITGLLILDSLITGNWVIFKDALWHIFMPSFTLALGNAGMVARLTRSAVLEILGEDYITAARSYGLKDSFILWVYALKNSLGTTITVVSMTVGYMLMGAFLIESIFSWPGIGRYVGNAVMAMDYPVIMGVAIFTSAIFIIMNLVADLLIALDPRIRV